MNPRRRLGASGLIMVLLLMSAFAIAIVVPTAHAQQWCTTTYSTSSPPAQQLTISKPGIYCFEAGTYNTQITITASNVVLSRAPGTAASQVIIMPTSVTNNAVNPHGSGTDRNPPTIPAIIYVVGVTGVVVEGLTIDGSGAASTLPGCIPTNSCYIGMLFWDSSGEVEGTTVTKMNTYESNPTPGWVPFGNGIFVATPPGGSSSVNIFGNTITYYAKNGITCLNTGTTCTITDNYVSPLAHNQALLSPTASNGIEIGHNATGTISGNVVVGNVYGAGGGDLIADTQATGIVTYLVSGNVTIWANALTGNDVGIFLQSDTGTITATYNTVSGSTYVGLAVYDESQTVSNNAFSSEPVGIEAASDTTGLNATATVSCNTFSSVTTQTTTEVQSSGGVAGAIARIVQGPSSCSATGVSPLTVPTISPSNPMIDYGQSATFPLTVAWAGGTSSYTVNLYSSPTSYCSSSSTLVSTTSSLRTSISFFVSPTATVYYCATVKDSATVPATTLSGVALFTVNYALSATISPAAPNIDKGQSITLTALPLQGAPPYLYQWYTGTTCGTGSGSKISGAASASYSTGVLNSTGNYGYSVLVTDSSVATPAGSTCAYTAVTVSPAIAPMLVLSPQVMDAGHPKTITAMVNWSGISPYKITLYSGSSPNCASDTTTVTVSSGSNPQTGVTGTSTTFSFPAPASNTYYCVTVTDSATTPATASTSTVLLTVNPSLGTAFLAVSPTVIDAGQSTTIAASVSWSGGTSPYAVTLYSGSSPSCASDTTIVASSSTTATAASFAFPSPVSRTYYCATVTDSATKPATVSTSTVLFTVNPSLGTVLLTISPTAVDSGLSTTVTASVSWSGGTSPYTVTLYSSPSANCGSGDTVVAVLPGFNPMTGVTKTTETFTFAPPATNTYYCARVGDNTTMPAMMSSASQLTVNPPLIPPIIGAPPAIDKGQSVVLRVITRFSGGTPTYTCQWLQEAPGANSFSSFLIPWTCTTVTTLPWAPDTLSTVGVWHFELKVTDGSSPPMTVTSAPINVTVNYDQTIHFAISPTAIDLGQSATVNATATLSYPGGGTSPYTVTLYSGSSSSCASDTVVVTPLSGTNPQTDGTHFSASFTFTAPGSTTFYCAKVTDSSATPMTTSSSTAEFSVNPVLSVSPPVLSPLVLVSGHATTVSASVSWSGGAPPYAVTLYSSPSTNCGPLSTVVAVLTGFNPLTGATGTKSTFTFAPPVTSTYYCAVVTDSSSTPLTVTSASVTVGYGPEGVAASNPTLGMVYVADPLSNHITVIDVASNTAVTTVTVGSLPWGIAVNPITNVVYVTNYGSGTVTVIDGTTNKVITTITVGTGPEGIAVNPALGEVYVADSGSNVVSVINATTNTVIASVPVGSNPTSVAIGASPTNAPYEPVFVTDYGSNTVSVIQPHVDGSYGVTPVAVGGSPWGVAVDNSTNRVYVTNSGSGTVSVLNGSTFATVTTITIGTGSTPEGIAINAAASMAYVANAGSNTVSVINTATNKVITSTSLLGGSIPSSVALFLSANPSLEHAYVANAGSNTVSVINIVTDMVVATIVVS